MKRENVKAANIQKLIPLKKQKHHENISAGKDVVIISSRSGLETVLDTLKARMPLMLYTTWQSVLKPEESMICLTQCGEQWGCI